MNTKRQPAHPGRILKNMYIEPLNLKVSYLAAALKVSPQTINALINEQINVSPEMALKLSRAFDTSADFWLNLQQKYELWYAETHTETWKDIQPIYKAVMAL